MPAYAGLGRNQSLLVSIYNEQPCFGYAIQRLSFKQLPGPGLYLTDNKLMDWKIFLTIFGAVFIAELGDKTQLATMLFATDKEVNKYTVFLAASAALVVASAMGVLAGSLLSDYINEKYLHYIAGIGFIMIGALTLYKA
ncbi:MAG: putative Ca2+/H+ antiporter (TMEM165/GDT1 family) [Planctomycetota bacterium]|jgi:putative Ca2+/H+ antiporter (TMEM165/GDT1 family)